MGFLSMLMDNFRQISRNRKNINDSDVLEAFRESQDRVISMSLIHEELYRGGGFEKLNFSLYVREQSDNLLKTYSLGKKNISLNLNLENNVLFDMDVAVPLEMIINELVSNSFKHAFKGRDEEEIQIKLYREENGSYFKTLPKTGLALLLL
jgi:two-component sensor histidine kinase